jgi:hypothetical protein
MNHLDGEALHGAGDSAILIWNTFRQRTQRLLSGLSDVADGRVIWMHRYAKLTAARERTRQIY